MKCESIKEREKLIMVSLVDEEIKRQDIEIAKITEKEKDDIRKVAIIIKPFIKRKSDLFTLKNSIQSIPLSDDIIIDSKYKMDKENLPPLFI